MKKFTEKELAQYDGEMENQLMQDTREKCTTYRTVPLERWNTSSSPQSWHRFDSRFETSTPQRRCSQQVPSGWNPT